MLLPIDFGDALFRRFAPSEKDDTFRLLIDRPHRRTREFLPSFARVRRRFVRLHGERGVEEEHAALRPCLQVAVFRWFEVGILGSEFFVHVAKRRRHGDAMTNGKGETVSLTDVVIRVLTEDDDAHFVERSVTGPGVDIGSGREEL